MREAILLAAATGLLGGFGHCIGMCGPLVAAFALRDRERFPLVPLLLYHGGRVITYSFIGALMGLGGSFVDTAARLGGIQNISSVAAGTVMVIMGIGISGVFRLPSAIDVGSPLLKAGGFVLDGTSPLRYFPLGLLLGFLPCGLSLSMFVGAAATGDMAGGLFVMLSFGLATVPALLLFAAVVSVIGARVRGVLYRAGGIMVIVMGLLFIVRGIRAHVAM